MILIDDANAFDGGGDYPHIDAIRELFARDVVVTDEIIRIHPKFTAQNIARAFDVKSA